MRLGAPELFERDLHFNTEWEEFRKSENARSLLSPSLNPQWDKPGLGPDFLLSPGPSSQILGKGVTTDWKASALSYTCARAAAVSCAAGLP